MCWVYFQAIGLAMKPLNFAHGSPVCSPSMPVLVIRHLDYISFSLFILIIPLLLSKRMGGGLSHEIAMIIIVPYQSLCWSWVLSQIAIAVDPVGRRPGAAENPDVARAFAEAATGELWLLWLTWFHSCNPSRFASVREVVIKKDAKVGLAATN